MLRGVFDCVVMRPNVVGLVRLRLGSLRTLWFKTFVNWKLNVAPTRSPMRPKSFSTLASRFQRGSVRTFPKPPQLVSMPRMHGRNSAYTAAGFANRFTPYGLFVPMPPVPDTL